MRDELDRMLDAALGDDPRRAVAAARRLREESMWIEQRAVAMARTAGYDWGRIGRLLGVTRQSARSRFAKLVPSVPPHMRAANRSVYQADREQYIRSSNRLREEHYLDGLSDDDIVAW